MTVPPFAPQNFRGRVVVLEEPSVFREMQSLLLQHAGYDVVNCDTLPELLAELGRRPVDVVVLNSDHAGSDTPDLFVAMRRGHPCIAILYIASVVTADLERRLAGLGITDVLQRPVASAALVLKLDAALGFIGSVGAPKLHDTAVVMPPRVARAAASLRDAV